MKVIHIFHSLKFSGAEIMYVDAATFFHEKGCELTAMATADDLGEYVSNFEQAGYKVLHQPMPPLKKYFQRIKYYKAMIKLLKKGHYDVVHIHSSSARWGFALCAAIVGIKSVYTFHNVFPTGFLTYPYHFLLRWSAKTIFKCRFQTISDSVHDHELNLYHNKTTKIYNWYGNNRYYPAKEDEKSLLRKELGISEQTLILISVGGCSPVKRHSDIIKALPHILKTIPDCLYLHLGKGCIEKEEMELAVALGIDQYIRFCGNQQDVRKYLAVSDVYLMPSRFEGIPITTIEAMACKIPAILYDVPGLRDFNKNGENSILIAEGYQLLADSVIHLFANKTKAIAIASNAKSMVESIFNMQDNATEIYSLYV